MPARKKQNKDREKDKAYEFVLVIYPNDNEIHSLAYLKLTSYQYSALGVLHDKDRYTEDKINEETGELIYKVGDLKKPHYHFYVKFRNQRYINGVAEELNIENHLIDFLDSNFVSYAEYMLHWGKYAEAGKYIYDVDCFEGSLASSAKQKLSNEDKLIQGDKVYRFIQSCSYKIKMSDVYEWCFKNGYASVYYSKRAHIKDWVEDHNEQFYKCHNRI